MMPLCHPSFCRYKPSLTITTRNRLSRPLINQRIPSRNASWFSKSTRSKELQSQPNDIKSLYKQARSEYKDKYFRGTKDAFDETLVQSGISLDTEGKPFQTNKVDYREYKKMLNADEYSPYLHEQEEPKAFKKPPLPLSSLQPGLLLGREELYKAMINLVKKRKRFAWKVKMRKQLDGAPFAWMSRIPFDNMTVQECLDVLGFYPWEARLLNYHDIHSRALQLAGINHPDVGGNPFFYKLIEACRSVLDVKYKYMDDEKRILAHNDFEVLIHLGLDEFYKYMKNQVEFNTSQFAEYDWMHEIAAPKHEKELAFLENSGQKEPTLMAAIWRAWQDKDKKAKEEKRLMHSPEHNEQMQNALYLQWKDSWRNMTDVNARKKFIREEAMKRNRASYYGSKVYLPGDWKE